MTEVSEENNYSICVYESTYNVPDNQTISTQFTSISLSNALSSNAHLPPMNLAVNFMIVARTSSICMFQTHLHSEHGRVTGDMSTETISDFRNPDCSTQWLCPDTSVGVMAEAMQGQ